MGQLKKLDISGFLSRTEGGHLELTYRESFLRADKLLVDIDEILGSCGIEGIGSIGYVSLEPQISKLYEDVIVLANYPSELTFEFSSVDDDFAHDVQDAVNALSTIKIDDIRIKNEFGVTYTEESFDGFEYVYETRMKDSISLTDFLGGGYTGLRREETTFVEGFTDVIYSHLVTEDKDLKTVIAEKSNEIDAILHGAEFNAASYQPAKEMLSQTLEIASMGIYPLMECVAGYDLITKEILTDDEMGRLMFMMGLELTFVPLMMGKGFAQFFINLAASAGGAVTSVTTAKLCEEMGATELQTFLISSLVGLAAGYALHCSGESVYEFYKQHENEIASNMAKNASDNVGSLVEEMVDDVDDLAVESQYKNADTLTKPSGVLDDVADDLVDEADDLAVKTQNVNLDQGGDTSKHYLHRSYIRKYTMDGVNANTKVNYKTGLIYDSISNKWVDPVNVELGHVRGKEFWRLRNWAEAQGMTQEEFNNYMNNPDFYAWQDITSNRSHFYEQQ